MRLHRALEVLRDHGPLTPAQFARRYFSKDDPGWQRHCKCGPRGTHRGSGLVMAAGGILGKLRRRGWARYHATPANQTAITDAGLTELRNWERVIRAGEAKKAKKPCATSATAEE